VCVRDCTARLGRGPQSAVGCHHWSARSAAVTSPAVAPWAMSAITRLSARADSSHRSMTASTCSSGTTHSGAVGGDEVTRPDPDGTDRHRPVDLGGFQAVPSGDRCSAGAPDREALRTHRVHVADAAVDDAPRDAHPLGPPGGQAAQSQRHRTGRHSRTPRHRRLRRRRTDHDRRAAVCWSGRSGRQDCHPGVRSAR
jgi:hypothetical protein